MHLTRRRALLAATTTIALPVIALPVIAMPGPAGAADTALPGAAKAFGATVQAQGAAPKRLRLAVLSFQGSSFWQAADQGIAAVTAYLAPLNSTVDYIQLGTALTAEAVVTGIDGALAKQYDGIAVVPIFDGTVAKVNEAVAAGVPVIAFIADSAQKSNRTVAVGQQAYRAGASAGAFIIKQLDGRGKIAVITGYLGAAQHKARMDGALDLIRRQAPGITIIGPFECKDDDAAAYSQATDAMTSNPDLKIIYVTAGGSTAVAKAVRDANATGRVGVVGYDNLPEKQIYKQGGEILALVDQAPARQSFDSLVMLHNVLAFHAKYPSEIPITAPIAYGKFARA